MTKYVTGGVSQNRNGTWKVRHSTLSVEDSVVRQVKAGDEHIMYVELPREMGREELPAYLLTLTEFNTNAAYKAVIEATMAKKAPKPVKVKAKAAPVKAPAKVKMPSKPQSVRVDARTAELAAA